MKLATLRDGNRDGMLAVVSKDLVTACSAASIAATMQDALDDWDKTSVALRDLSGKLNRGEARGAFPFDPRKAMAPLPRAYQWVDGSVYSNHNELMRRAFDGEPRPPEPPPREPKVYQGGSDHFLGPCDDIVAADEAWGIDFEGEVAVVTRDVAMQTSAADAERSILLITLTNDISLRNLIPAEMAKRFGFYQSKPASSFSPIAATPDELGGAWHGGLVHLPLLLYLNGEEFGRPNAGVGARFNFFDLIAYTTKTRRLCAGTIVGGGTVSNADPAVGSACIAERRAQERITFGAPKTPYLRFGDRIRIEMLDESGQSIFGAMDQRIAALPAGA